MTESIRRATDSIDTVRGAAAHLREKRLAINEKLQVSIEGPETIAIHLTGEKEDSIPIHVKSSPIFKGFRSLSKMFNNHPKLYRIQEILAYSAIVAEHPGAMQKLGFTNDAGNHPFFARMQRKYKTWAKIERHLGHEVPLEAALAFISSVDFQRLYGDPRDTGATKERHP